MLGSSHLLVALRRVEESLGYQSYLGRVTVSSTVADRDASSQLSAERAPNGNQQTETWPVTTNLFGRASRMYRYIVPSPDSDVSEHTLLLRVTLILSAILRRPSEQCPCLMQRLLWCAHADPGSSHHQQGNPRDDQHEQWLPAASAALRGGWPALPFLRCSHARRVQWWLRSECF
ncbi:uncharacterized protein EI97DRAFT_3251 [Westerdykella ornata]|uniref:Uncharacterized protein n=1 Tax=Westerdykella ornata TaxID=318751 RepID=A0A6A6JVJ4_WESOR|nr:uncharacterized protein EI97DRAFT_3251 [Westerdykella ornata]KAF2280622.1 hypothetical protein EI97DRAFT_3251 [Westerdykella ornata]